jgi:predicted Zn-dependent peptidase
MKNIIKTHPSGLRVVIRTMPNFKSVATSVYVAVGSRDELSNEFGLSHFVEHMLFKGTTTRTSEQITGELSGLGVDYNAYTSTSATCYHTRGLATNIDKCCDILSDMYFNLKFKEEDFRREAEVIVQEILMRDDHPRLALSELAAESFWAGTVYGHNIAGTVESVRSFKPEDIYAYMRKHYTAPNTIIAFAGDVTEKQADEMVTKYFMPKFTELANPNVRIKPESLHKPKQQFATKIKDTEQQNVALLFPACAQRDADRFPLIFLNEIFSSDMSSRLFTSVRERQGLVYSISGGLALYDIGGYYYIYFSCTPGNTEKVLTTIADEIKKLCADGVTNEEMQKVRNIKQTDRLFESENVEATNQRNVTLLAEFNEIETAEEYLRQVDAVTQDDVKNVANKYLNYDSAVLALVGKNVKLEPFKVLK